MCKYPLIESVELLFLLSKTHSFQVCATFPGDYNFRIVAVVTVTIIVTATIVAKLNS